MILGKFKCPAHWGDLNRGPSRLQLALLRDQAALAIESWLNACLVCSLTAVLSPGPRTY